MAALLNTPHTLLRSGEDKDVEKQTTLRKEKQKPEGQGPKGVTIFFSGCEIPAAI